VGASIATDGEVFTTDFFGLAANSDDPGELRACVNDVLRLFESTGSGKVDVDRNLVDSSESTRPCGQPAPMASFCLIRIVARPFALSEELST
jgi:hypothetical protein